MESTLDHESPIILLIAPFLRVLMAVNVFAVSPGKTQADPSDVFEENSFRRFCRKMNYLYETVVDHQTRKKKRHIC